MLIAEEPASDETVSEPAGMYVSPPHGSSVALPLPSPSP